MDHQKTLDFQRAKELKQLIQQYDHEYYVLAQPTILDSEYDRLYEEYVQLELTYPELKTPDSPTQRVGGEPLESLEKIEHLSPLLSIDQKPKEIEALAKWHREMGGDGVELIVQAKFDGVTIDNVYQEHLLQTGATRGNGYIGELVTENVKVIKSVPLSIPFQGLLEVRGEAIAPYESFKARFSDEYSNPRNFVAGTIRQLDARLVAERQPDIIWYDLGQCDQRFQTDEEQLEFLKAQGFKVAPYVVVSTLEELIQVCQSKLNGWIQSMDGFNIMKHENPAFPQVMCDGLVVKVNDLTLREKIGMTAKGPKWAIAYKFDSLSETTTLKKVEYQVGRTGRIVPVANFKKVSLGGTNITKATLNNADYIKQLDLKIGSLITIERSNDVIPRIIGLAEEDQGQGKPIEFPTVCPCCQTPLEVIYPLHFCPNKTCPDRIKGMIKLAASRDALNITGLGQSIVDLIVDQGWVQQLSDLYRLLDHREELLTFDGFGEKKVDKLLAAIEKSKQTEAWRVLYALGIENVGRRMSKELMSHFHSIQAIFTASDEELHSIPDLGPSTVQTLRESFKNLSESGEFERLQQLLPFENQLKADQSEELNGITFVITGTLQEKRNYYQEIVERCGGKVQSSVSKKTHVVLVGDDAGSKETKARELIAKGESIQLLEGHEAFVAYCQSQGITI